MRLKNRPRHQSLGRRAGDASVLLHVRALPSDRTRGRLVFGSLDVPCALGRGGLTHRKREGDGATPVGQFALVSVFYRVDRGARPRTDLPSRALKRTDGWCDDPADGRYNRLVRLPFAGSHEVMWRDDRLYAIVVVLDCNLHPRVRGRGSAIFFHVAREDFPPTEGCVTVAPHVMRRLLAMAGRNTVMSIG